MSGRRPAPEAVLVDSDALPEALPFVREARAAGVVVALAGDGFAEEFDAVIEVAAPKPGKEYFAAACAVLDTPPERCLFVAGEDRSVRGARVAGLSGYRWNGLKDLNYLLAVLGIAPRT